MKTDFSIKSFSQKAYLCFFIFVIMFSSVNIQDELVKSKQKHSQIQHSLKQQVEDATKKSAPVDEFIIKRLRIAPKPGYLEAGSPLLDKNNIFSNDDIKRVCIQYRLRFLDYNLFDNEELPRDAVEIIKNLEKETGKEAVGLKMLTSSRFFKSKDVNHVPVLLAQLDENNFYLIHKQAEGYSWFRKWASFPFRNIWALLLTLVVVGLPLMFIIPALLFRSAQEIHYYQMLYLAAFTIYTLFISVFGGFTFYKKFSIKCWNSSYSN
ncbi:MAG: hypothetical protein ACLQQ4_04535 [Bacteroidia bacterium]